MGQEFSTEDYVRAIRHGMDPAGKPIFLLAVGSTAHLSDEDLAAIIAKEFGTFYDDEWNASWMYLQSLPKLPQYTE